MENVKYIPGDLVKLKYNGKAYHISKIIPSIFDDIIRIQSVEDGCLCVEHKDKIKEKIEGVPLTPQILEANGWKPDGEWLRFRTGKAYIYICESSSQRGTYLVCVGDNKYFIACISYIHQLQHLLFGLGLDSSLKV